MQTWQSMTSLISDQIQKLLGQLTEMDNDLCSKKDNLKEELKQTVLKSDT